MDDMHSISMRADTRGFGLNADLQVNAGDCRQWYPRGWIKGHVYIEHVFHTLTIEITWETLCKVHVISKNKITELNCNQCYYY